ncbi:MAG: enoyl-CoA hydratase/isomerase family protein [Betaproteobacteria bacterium]
MEPTVSRRRQGGLTWIEANNPPVNALSVSVRRELLRDLVQSSAVPCTTAIVIGAKGRTFFAGAEIDELEHGVQPPGLMEFIHACDHAPQPVIAALHGTVFGGGVVVAYACDWRVAAPHTQIALPEVSLGLLPTFGGTQWLPRWLGVEAALGLTIDGKVWTTEQALSAGLVDEVADTEHLATAVQHLADQGPPKRRITDPALWKDESQTDISAAFDRRRAHLSAHAPDFEAAWTCLEVMQRGLTLPIDEALQLEARAFEQLRRSEQSRRLRRLFFAERKLRRCNAHAIAQLGADIVRLDSQDSKVLERLAHNAVAQQVVPDLAVFDALVVQVLKHPRHRRSLIADLIDA